MPVLLPAQRLQDLDLGHQRPGVLYIVLLTAGLHSHWGRLENQVGTQ